MKPNRALKKVGISVIVPVFREAKTIHGFLEAVQRIFPAPDNEIIVVDGSPEGETLSAIHLPRMVPVAAPTPPQDPSFPLPLRPRPREPKSAIHISDRARALRPATEEQLAPPHTQGR